MATRDIRTSLILDGEQKFSAELKSAQRNLSILRKEVEAEARAFEANGKQADANRTRLNGLRQQQQQQRTIVQALNKAMQEAAQKYGETSAKTDSYRAKLANAKAELLKMETAEKELVRQNERTGKSFDQLKKEVSQGWREVGTQVGNSLKTVAGVATGVFASVTAAAAGAGKTVLDWTVDAAQQADDLLTQSQVTGIDTTTLQQWQYASHFIDVQVDTITGSIAKLRKNMTSGSKDMEAAFKFFGVRLTDDAGQYRDAQGVFWDVLDQIQANPVKFGNTTETDNYLQQVFGKSYQDLMPLILNGRKAWEGLGQEAMDAGIVLDQDTVAAFGEFNDTLDRINANIGGIKNGIAQEFLPEVQNAAGEVEDLTGALVKFVHGDATVDEVTKEAEEVVAAVVGAVEKGLAMTNELIAGLQASDDPNVRAVGDMLAGIRDAGLSLWENRDNILAGIEAIVGIWAATKITTAVTNMGKFAAGVGNLVVNMLDLIANAGAYEDAAGRIAGAGGWGGQTPAGGAGNTDTGSMIGGAAGASGALSTATLLGISGAASAASIFAAQATHDAATAMADAVYEATEGTEAEKNKEAWNAYYDVAEPGMTGSFAMVKGIADWWGDVTQGAAKMWEDWTNAPSYMDVYAQEQKYENIAKGAQKIYDLLNERESREAKQQQKPDTEVLKDLDEYITLKNWRSYMETGQGENLPEYNHVLDMLDAINKKYGGSIMGNTEEGKQYMGIIQSMSPEDLDMLPTVDAVFNLKPAEGAEQAMQDAVNRMNLRAAVQLVPTGINAGAYSLGGLVGAGGQTNVTVTLDGKVVGSTVAPIINGILGRRLG